MPRKDGSTARPGCKPMTIANVLMSDYEGIIELAAKSDLAPSEWCRVVLHAAVVKKVTYQKQ
jgi:hypothetical protein